MSKAIGQGGFCKVYEGMLEGNIKPVAVKVVIHFVIIVIIYLI